MELACAGPIRVTWVSGVSVAQKMRQCWRVQPGPPRGEPEHANHAARLVMRLGRGPILPRSLHRPVEVMLI